MMKKRFLTTALFCISVCFYQQAGAQEKFIEAESAVLSNGARIEACSTCSGGNKIGGLGDLRNGTAVFNLTVPKAGIYPVMVYFRVSDDRSLRILVNQDADGQQIVFRRTKPADESSQQRILVALKAGINKLSFDNPVEGGPELDRISYSQAAIRPVTSAGQLSTRKAKAFPLVKGPAVIKKLSVGNIRLEYNMKTGTANFYNGTKLLLANVYAEVKLPEAVSSREYSKHVLKEEKFTDQLGDGTLFTVTSSSKGLPEMSQEYWLYTGKEFMLSRVSIKSEKELSTNYMSPLKSGTSIKILPEGENSALFVPFDNDKWVRYVAFPFGKVVSSHEASVLFNEGSGQGLVIGSVDHNNWKSGVVTATSGSNLDRLEVYGGFTYATSRDILPHGKIKGKMVQSPRMFIGNYSDWRDGMNDFAAANSGLHHRMKWPGGAPFGWNSWGKIQFNLTGQKAVEVSDFFAKELKDKGFENDGVTYIGLDAGAEDRTDAELTAFVNECKKNNQVPGGYYGPFADWGGDSTRRIEGTPYTYKDLYLRAHGNKQYIDGAAAIDPTHPGTKARIKKSLERFKRLGFKFMKVDFLAHASLEADHYFNPKVTTGIQAYNEGMKYLRETLGDSIYLNQAISPIFPADYAQSRRIACDVFGDTEKIEYAMNALTYGWWLSNVYLYNDADHIVLEGHSEAENRSRVTSSVTTGIFISGDDLSAGGSAEAKSKTIKFLSNPDVNDIARSGKSFKPVYAAEGGKAANAFVREDEHYLYLALFNYGSAALNLEIPVEAISKLPLRGLNYKELWTGKKGNAETSIKEIIPPADVRILRFDLPQK